MSKGKKTVRRCKTGPCPDCRGMGMIDYSPWYEGGFARYAECPRCNGTGTVSMPPKEWERLEGRK